MLVFLLITAIIQGIADAQWNGAQCSAFIGSCNPIVTASCAAQVCQSCTALGEALINDCCSQNSAPTACFLSLAEGLASSTLVPTITSMLSSPVPTSKAVGAGVAGGSLACASVAEYSSGCANSYQGFTDLAFTDQASCLCYNTMTSWVPQTFDQYWASCLTYFASASPEGYASITSADGPIATDPCQVAGNVITATAGGSAGGSGLAACSTVLSILPSQCAQKTPGFSSLPWTEQASCLCYSGTIWAPQQYDTDLGSCYNYFSTADPSDYSGLTANGPLPSSPCHSLGNFLVPASNGVVSTSSAAPIAPVLASSVRITTPLTRTASTTSTSPFLVNSVGSTSSSIPLPMITSKTSNTAKEVKVSLCEHLIYCFLAD